MRTLRRTLAAHWGAVILLAGLLATVIILTR